MKTLTIVLLTAFAFTGPARAEEKSTEPVTVPFELLRSGHMAVQIKVNGKGPYRVIFDTGAPISLLNNKIAKEAGLLKDAEKPLFNLFGTMGQVIVKSLQVGDLKAENVNAIIMDHPTIDAISRVLGPVHGIVGFPFFARYRMTLDYKAKELTFVPNGFEPPDVMEALMAGMMLMSGNGKAPTQAVAPAGQWGMVIKEDAASKGEAGVKVTKVYSASAAAKAGIKEGDRILSLDGRWTDSMADLYTAAGYAKPGVETKVTIQRDGKELEVKVRPTSGF
jgi:membrane-associated protease RseP (regulator of RpoE activity)